jgi:hypothetical protein
MDAREAAERACRDFMKSYMPSISREHREQMVERIGQIIAPLLAAKDAERTNNDRILKDVRADRDRLAAEVAELRKVVAAQTPHI